MNLKFPTFYVIKLKFGRTSQTFYKLSKLFNAATPLC